ncbi:MAG TPA: Ig-like domain-containing protein [Cyclobacteriaceae bacterium]|nr:Ig-like domain-containing protein [Cyclobacteriaceae bacterium]
MKKLMTMLAVFAMAGLVLNGCKDDDPTPLTLATLKAGDKDLNGATSATDVAVNSPITIVFSTDIDASTANDNTILLTRTFNSAAVPKTVSVSGNTITVTPTANFFAGDQYKIQVTGDLKSNEGQALTAVDRTFGTVGIGLGTAPQAAKQMLYVQFGNDIVDLTGNATKGAVQVAYTADRFGNANSAAQFRGATTAGTGDIVELASNSLIAPSMTLSVWFYINQADYVAPGNKPMLGLGAQNGYFIEIGDGPVSPNWLKLTTNHKVDPDPKAHVTAQAWGDFGSTDDAKEVNTLTKTGWHHLVMTFDAATYTKTDYLDGVKIKTFNLLDVTNNEWNLKDIVLKSGAGIGNKLALGFFADKSHTADDWANYAKEPRTFKGSMDDLRLFNVALSASEVTTLYTAEKP